MGLLAVLSFYCSLPCFFLLRRRQHIATQVQQPGVFEYVPELAKNPIQPQELQEGGLYGLQHDLRYVHELPPAPSNPDGSVFKG